MSGVSGVTPQPFQMPDPLDNARLHGGGHGGHRPRISQAGSAEETQAASQAQRPRASAFSTVIRDVDKESSNDQEQDLTRDDHRPPQSEANVQPETGTAEPDNPKMPEDSSAAILAEWQAMNPTFHG